MGLDMTLYAKEKGEEAVEIGCWRKHKDLHRYIEGLWREKTGSEEEFNCVEFILSRENLLDIGTLSMKGELPQGRSGFFYGESYPEDDAKTVTLVTEALNLQKEGQTIIYNSWW